jgi:hypothetical protein
LADWREHKAQSDAYIQAVRQRQQEWRDKVAADEQARLDRDRNAWAEKNRRRAQQAADLQAAQAAFGERVREMRAAVATLRSQVDGAQGRVDRADMADAVTAAGEVIVLRRRLEIAESELKLYERQSPM